ncbi:MAG TPA: hypothetical protein VIN59_02145 [Alphaproteobacteria bacterium]
MNKLTDAFNLKSGLYGAMMVGAALSAAVSILSGTSPLESGVSLVTMALTSTAVYAASRVISAPRSVPLLVGTGIMSFSWVAASILAASEVKDVNTVMQTLIFASGAAGIYFGHRDTKAAKTAYQTIEQTSFIP